MNNKLREMLRSDIEYYDSMMSTTPLLSSIRHKEQELLSLLEDGISPPAPKHEYVSAGDLKPLETKYGSVQVLACDGTRVNIEVRDPIDVAGGTFRGCFTVEFTNGSWALTSRICYWNSGLTDRREKLLLQEVLAKIEESSRIGFLGEDLNRGARRDVNNELHSVEQAITAAEKALFELRASQRRLLAAEAELGPL